MLSLNTHFLTVTRERALYKSFYLYFFLLTGACTVRLEMPLDMQSALIFHYNLKFYNNDADNYEGISLKRFVMQVKHFLFI